MSIEKNEGNNHVRNSVDYSAYDAKADEEVNCEMCKYFKEHPFIREDDCNDFCALSDKPIRKIANCEGFEPISSKEEEDMSDSDCIDLLDDVGEGIDPNKYCKHLRDSNPIIDLPSPFVRDNISELEILGFFNDFTLVEMGMHDFIREVYFEE